MALPAAMHGHTRIFSRDRTDSYYTTCGLIARLIPCLAWRHSGLGMLQAYVHEGTERELRVHIWHNSLRKPGIEDSGLLHDHRFDLFSQVLVGTIQQVEYDIEEDNNGPYRLHTVVHARKAQERHASNDGGVSPLPKRYGIKSTGTFISAGCSYHFPKRRFHGTFTDTDLVVTLVTKGDQDEVPARILAPHDKPVVHAFADPLPESAWTEPMALAVEALTKIWKDREDREVT